MEDVGVGVRFCEIVVGVGEILGVGVGELVRLNWEPWAYTEKFCFILFIIPNWSFVSIVIVCSPGVRGSAGR